VYSSRISPDEIETGANRSELSDQTEDLVVAAFITKIFGLISADMALSLHL
jgi:hypothetical protein